MSNADDRDREIAELKAQVERLNAGRAAPPKVDVTGGLSSGNGLKGGFFGCLGIIAAIVVVIVCLIALRRCSKEVGDLAAAASDTPPASSAAASAAAAGVSAAPAANWTYTEKADALSNGKTKMACTTSINEVNLSFPYHATNADLCVRRSPRNGLDAFVQLNADGQILCGIESCTVPIRFDQKATQKFPAVGAADNSPNIIFIGRTTGLISSLQKSQTAVVELTFYQNGDQSLTFNTAGFEWR